MLRILCQLLCLMHMTQAEPCFRNTTSCVVVEATMCLTTKVTFTHTSLLYTNNTLAQSDISTQLEAWTHLQGVPECWNVIQPFLCSVYLPKCDAVKQRVEMPNRELCERVRAPCEVVKRYNDSWPWFLQCDQWFYAEKCGQTVYETSNFDTTSQCASPLVSTSLEGNWYDEIKGCGLQCESPLYTSHEHWVADILIAIFASFGIASSVFTLVTFILDWKVSRKYPAVILFYINLCFLIAMIGWLVQFMIPDDVTCRKDGTIRISEPLIGSGETASCTVVFVMIYYCTLAGVVWFVMLGYAWDIHFKALGTVRDDLSKKTAYFHIISWCLPLVLTIVCLSTSVIDADSISGICFPGFNNMWVRTGYVLAPICITLMLGTIFSVRGLQTLCKVKKASPPFIGQKATAKIHDTIIRLAVFIGVIILLVLISLSVHIYSFTHTSTWDDSLMDFTYCQANVSVMQILDNAAPSTCKIQSRPSVVAAIFHIFAFFGVSLAFSSWSWSKASIDIWRRTWYRLCNKPVNRPHKTRKHRLVARSFKRQKRRSNERLSISYGTDRDDAIGMRFDRSSMSSHSRSSGFAMTVPKHGGRRLRGVLPSHVRRAHRHRSDSDAGSQGNQDQSRRTRRSSYESSMSQKLSDIERELREEERRRRRKKRRKRRQNRIQPIFGPIADTMTGLSGSSGKSSHGNGRRGLRARHRYYSDSSDVSKLSVQNGALMTEKNHFPMQSLGSSNILSDSVVTGNSNSVSEIELPQPVKKLPDFSIFTAKSALPPVETKEDNSNVNSNGPNLKGANPSPSGSVRRGRRREVKLEMTETSFYQEDDENIEIGGNQTIHAEQNCQEVGEMRANIKELGPLVNEIFEQARASGSGRNSRQKDPFGSSRLGSASSRGSRSSRGSSQVNSKDLKYATAKVHLPPERPKIDPDRTSRKRPFSGDYIITAQRNNAKQEESTRKSQSQPGSRVSSATSAHKRQIGHNGRLDFTDGISWSRFLQGKGYNGAGPLFGPIDNSQMQQPNSHQTSFQNQNYSNYHHNKYQSDLFSPFTPGQGRNQMGLYGGKGQAPLFNQDISHCSDKPSPRIIENEEPVHSDQLRQVPYPGQLQLMDKPRFENEDLDQHKTHVIDDKKATVSNNCQPGLKSYNRGQKKRDDNGSPRVDVLNIDNEHQKLFEMKRPYTNPYRKHRDPTEGDVLGLEPEQESLGEDSGLGSKNRSDTEHDSACNVLNVEAEHCQRCGKRRKYAGNVNVLNVEAEQIWTCCANSEFEGDDDTRTIQKRSSDKTIVNVDILNVEAEQRGLAYTQDKTVKDRGIKPEKPKRKTLTKTENDKADYPNEMTPKKHTTVEKHVRINGESESKTDDDLKSQKRVKPHVQGNSPTNELPGSPVKEVPKGAATEESKNINPSETRKNTAKAMRKSATNDMPKSDRKEILKSPVKELLKSPGRGQESGSEHRVIKTVANPLLDPTKVSAFDGRGPKKEIKVPQPNYAIKEQQISTSAVVLTNPAMQPLPPSTQKRPLREEKFVGPHQMPPKILQGRGNKDRNSESAKSKPIQLKSKKAIAQPPQRAESLKGNTLGLASKDNQSQASSVNKYPQSSSVLTSDTGTDSRTFSLITSSSRNSDNSRISNSTNASSRPPNGLNSNPGNDIADNKPKEKNTNKLKNVLPNGMFSNSGCTNELLDNKPKEKSTGKTKPVQPNGINPSSGYLNEILDSKPKEKSTGKTKPVPDRSVGMFDFVDCDDNLDTDYDDVSTDNLTDTYTYTDYDDDLTEVSSLPC